MNSLLLETLLYAIQHDWIIVQCRSSRSHFGGVRAALIPEYLPRIAFEEFDCIGDELRGDLEFLGNHSGSHSGKVPLQQLRLFLKSLHISLLDVSSLLSHSVTNPSICVLWPLLALIKSGVRMELLFVMEAHHRSLPVQVVWSQATQTLHHPLLGLRGEAVVKVRISEFEFESVQGLQAQRLHLGIAQSPMKVLNE